jgi:hypothetical protein
MNNDSPPQAMFTLSKLGDDFMTNDQLLTEIGSQRDLMIAVATGGPQIDTVKGSIRSAVQGSSSSLIRAGYPIRIRT